MQKKNVNIFLLINFIGITVIIIGIILCLIPLISVTAKKSTPQIFDHSIIKLENDSMLPEFENNQIIVVKSIDPDKIQIGNKIAYYIINEDGQATRKEFREVVNIFTKSSSEFFFEVKETASNAEHSIVHQDLVIGKYNEKAKGLASLFTFSTSSLGIFLLIVLPVALLIMLQLIVLLSINKKAKKLGD